MTSSRRPLSRGSLAALLASAVAVLPWSTASAQPAVRAEAGSVRNTSLGLAPSDAAFYGSTMRLGVTYERFVQSKAFARLQELDTVKQLTEEFLKEWNDPTSDFAQAKAVFDDPETRETLAFLGDMASHEMWSYGDMKHADLVELGAAVQLTMREAQFQMQMDQANGNEPNPMVIVNALIKALDENRAKIVVPNSITGFKVADAKRASEQLAKLDALIAQSVQGNPTLQPAYNKKQIGGTEFLVMDLKGNMVPWQIAGFFLQGIDFVAFNRVVGQLSQLELTIALGVKDDHVLVLVGESDKYLGTLGTDDSLMDRKEFAALRAKDGAAFTTVNYVSEAYRKRVYNPADQMAAFQQAAESMLPQAPLNDDLKQEILKDLGDFSKWAKEQVPTPGATLSFEYETDRGYEGFSYDWSENEMLDGSQPLPLVNHVGGNPIGFFVLRTNYDPAEYDMMVFAMKKAHGYVETYLMGELDEAERAKYQEVMKLVTPHLARLDKTTREKLLPASKDSQAAIVLDMKASSRQWFTEMPPAQKPLPMPELAFVYGVSDSELLRSAWDDYFDVGQKLLNDLHEFSPMEIEKMTIPTADAAEVEGGMLYKHSLPTNTGVDDRIAPVAGLGKNVAVWGYVPDQASRVLKSTPLATDGGPLANLDRNLAGAAAFNFAAFVDGVEPWIEYGVAQYFASQAVSTEGDFVQFEEPTMDEVIGQVRATAEVLKCFRGYSSVTYLEDEATVTHFDYHFEDLE